MYPISKSIKLHIDLYIGAYGRTLRIGIRNAQSLAFLRNIFHELAESKSQEKILSKSTCVYFTNCDTIQFCVSKQAEPIIEINDDKDGIKIIWLQSAAEWCRACSLIDGLAKHGCGHQYLAESGSLPITIVLSYCE